MKCDTDGIHTHTRIHTMILMEYMYTYVHTRNHTYTDIYVPKEKRYIRHLAA